MQLRQVYKAASRFSAPPHEPAGAASARPGTRCRGRAVAGAERVATRRGKPFWDFRDSGMGRHARRRTLRARRTPCPLGAYPLEE